MTAKKAGSKVFSQSQVEAYFLLRLLPFCSFSSFSFAYFHFASRLSTFLLDYCALFHTQMFFGIFLFFLQLLLKHNLPRKRA